MQNLFNNNSTKFGLVFIFFSCLIVGTACGYGLGYLNYSPKITALEEQVNEQKAQIAEMQEQLDTLLEATAEP